MTVTHRCRWRQVKRRFIDAPDAIRCAAVIRIGKAEHDTARCGRAATVGDLCTQHAKITNSENRGDSAS